VTDFAPENVPLADCFIANKENGNDENSAGALHAGVQAGSGQVGRGWAEHRSYGRKLDVVEQTLFNWVKAKRQDKVKSC